MKRLKKQDPSRIEYGPYYDQGFKRITVGLLRSTFTKGLSDCLTRNVIVTRIPKGADDVRIAEQLGELGHAFLRSGTIRWLDLQAECGRATWERESIAEKAFS